ncbi:LysR family transcriptional regulator [Xylophilus sp. GOD-11R]|uniref:LysR family transcriptional regulator n=1 Tax=Xylophilus sp. GOD-11R TaxID=3089814 RepID=UPI00298C48ED|nr:LysR family transcriptional regulator [Xylophilus sp. GOD-11R]WPB56123.1 LysR family transcriptional regulator [Xylophilus sp. GOD-11R]
MTRFTFRQIEAFYWCALLGTVHAAAQHLHVSQPAVSSRIKELEEALGLTLFSRAHQRFELTPAGRKALVHAEQTLRAGQELQRLGRRPVPLQGVLRLGADETGATVAATELLHRIKLLHPALKIELTVEVSKVLREKLARRELDVALHGTPTERPNVVDELLGRMPLVWIGAAGIDAGTTPLTPEHVAALPIVTNPPHSILHGLVKDWLQVSGYEFNSFSSCNSIAMIIRVVQSGHAIAALPLPVTQEALKSGLVRIIETAPLLPTMPYYISYLDDKIDSGVGDIVELARQILLSAEFFAQPVVAA